MDPVNQSNRSEAPEPRVDNPSVAPLMSVDPVLALLRVAGAAEAGLSGSLVTGADRQFSASLNTLREALVGRPGIIGVHTGIVRDSDQPRRGFVITTKGLDEPARSEIIGEAERLVTPFKVVAVPEEFLEEGRAKWHRERDDRIRELGQALADYSNVLRVSCAIRAGDGSRTNGVAIVVNDPEDPSMEAIGRIVGEKIKRPMYAIYFPPGYPGAAVGDLES